MKTVATNRRAKFDYQILETLEAGIVLTGSEVKSLRAGNTSLQECYAGEMLSDPTAVYLYNLTINTLSHASHFNHDPKRPRKLLLHKREVGRLLGNIRKKGITIVPMSLYFNARGILKLTIGVGKGKNTVDKRQTIKDRDWGRQKARVLRGSERD